VKGVAEMNNHHISLNDMERFSLGRIKEPQELAMLEEHLLWCEDCQHCLEATERFLDAVRAASVSESPYPWGFQQ
jgi:hypothetical protein